MKKLICFFVLLILVGCSGFDDSTSSSYYEMSDEELNELFARSSSSRSKSSSSFDFDCFYYDECDDGYSSSSEKSSSSSSFDYFCAFYGLCGDESSSSSVKSSSSSTRSSSSSVRSSSSDYDDACEVYGYCADDCEEYGDCDDFYSSSSAKSSSSSESSVSVPTERADVPTFDVNDNVFANQKEGCENCNAILDERDGNIYEVVIIIGVAWMAEDLRFEGNEDYPLAGSSWEGSAGRLYDFAAAMNDDYCARNVCNPNGDHYQGACPEGWVLPTENDWKAVANNYTLLKLSGTGEHGSSGVNDDGVSRYWSSSDYTSKASDGRGAIEFYVRGGFSSQAYTKSMGYGVRCIAVDDVFLDKVRD